MLPCLSFVTYTSPAGHWRVATTRPTNSTPVHTETLVFMRAASGTSLTGGHCDGVQGSRRFRGPERARILRAPPPTQKRLPPYSKLLGKVGFLPGDGRLARAPGEGFRRPA